MTRKKRKIAVSTASNLLTWELLDSDRTYRLFVAKLPDIEVKYAVEVTSCSYVAGSVTAVSWHLLRLKADKENWTRLVRCETNSLDDYRNEPPRLLQEAAEMDLADRHPQWVMTQRLARLAKENGVFLKAGPRLVDVLKWSEDKSFLPPDATLPKGLSGMTTLHSRSGYVPQTDQRFYYLVTKYAISVRRSLQYPDGIMYVWSTDFIDNIGTGTRELLDLGTADAREPKEVTEAIEKHLRENFPLLALAFLDQLAEDSSSS